VHFPAFSTSDALPFRFENAWLPPIADVELDANGEAVQHVAGTLACAAGWATSTLSSSSSSLPSPSLSSFPLPIFPSGFGCLFSLVLKEGCNVETFFDHLNVRKGPSLGTCYTLACPYTVLAHYDELAWAAACGVPASLIRVSVGFEDAEVRPVLWCTAVYSFLFVLIRSYSPRLCFCFCFCSLQDLIQVFDRALQQAAAKEETLSGKSEDGSSSSSCSTAPS